MCTLLSLYNIGSFRNFSIIHVKTSKYCWLNSNLSEMLICTLNCSGMNMQMLLIAWRKKRGWFPLMISPSFRTESSSSSSLQLIWWWKDVFVLLSAIEVSSQFVKTFWHEARCEPRAMSIWCTGHVKGNYSLEYLKPEWGSIFIITSYCTDG